MNLSDIQSAVKAKATIEITVGSDTYRGVPQISWKKRTVTLSQANGCKTTLEFDDIPGF